MIRTALFGLGNVAERIHLPACASVAELEVIGASEPRRERRAAMAERFSLPAVYADSAELLERERPELVIVGTPPDSHRELCLLALRSGADVLCEKPFMRTVEESDEVIAEAERAGRLLAVNTQYRHMAIYREARARWASGDLGRLFFIQCWQQMFHPASFETLAWRADLERSTLFEFGTHALDLLAFLFGALPVSITAHTPRVRSEFSSDVLVQATLRFPEERLATLAFNRVSHAPERYLEMRLDGDDASMRLSLGGVARAGLDLVRHRGQRAVRARASLVKGGEARIETGTRSRVIAREATTAFDRATADHLRELLPRRGGSEEDRLGSARHAREILRTALAGYESAESGRTVEL